MNQIRFHVYDGDNHIHSSEWAAENTRTDAGDVLTDVRKRMGGNYAYRIERTGDSKIPNPVKMYRYRIKVGESLFYSKLLMESEKDEALAQVKSLPEFRDAEITEAII